jgi:hypothetical protein
MYVKESCFFWCYYAGTDTFKLGFPIKLISSPHKTRQLITSPHKTRQLITSPHKTRQPITQDFGKGSTDDAVLHVLVGVCSKGEDQDEDIPLQ